MHPTIAKSRTALPASSPRRAARSVAPEWIRGLQNRDMPRPPGTNIWMAASSSVWYHWRWVDATPSCIANHESCIMHRASRIVHREKRCAGRKFQRTVSRYKKKGDTRTDRFNSHFYYPNFTLSVPSESLRSMRRHPRYSSKLIKGLDGVASVGNDVDAAGQPFKSAGSFHTAAYNHTGSCVDIHLARNLAVDRDSFHTSGQV